MTAVARLATTTNGTVGTTGTSPGRKPRKAARKTTARTVSTARRIITVGMGCGIPALSLALSSVGGSLLREQHYVLGSTALMFCAAVLAVSLSHLAWAIRDITGSSPWQSWCLAGAVDVSLVLGELAHVAGFESWVVPAVMASVSIVSAVLNCWAFIGHKCK
jgi:hypothetical protein